MFENIISGIQLYNKKYHQKLNHFEETEKDEIVCHLSRFLKND